MWIIVFTGVLSCFTVVGSVKTSPSQYTRIRVLDLNGRVPDAASQAVVKYVTAHANNNTNAI